MMRGPRVRLESPQRVIIGVIATAALAVFGGGSIWTSQARDQHGGASGEKGKQCTPSLVKPFRSPAYANTPWPTEHADVWRTHAAPTGLPADLGRVKLATESVALPPVPVWGYVGTGDKLYVVGGSPYLLNMFTQLMLGAPMSQIPALVARTLAASFRVTPYIAQIDARTMKVKVRRFTTGIDINYTGGLLVHSNGFVYAVVRGVLYKIDPTTFRVVASRRLPLPPNTSQKPNFFATYNGIAAASNGDLILKGWASTGGGANPPGTLLRVDPKDLSIRVSAMPTAISSARMAIVDRGGSEYVYAPDASDSVRFRIQPAAFTLDDSWTQGYIMPHDTQASSDVFMGQGVVFATNTSPTATTPTHVFAQSAVAGTPAQRVKAFSGDEIGWNFFMMVGDPYRSGIAAVGEQSTGRVAGYLVCGGGVSVKKLWENDKIHSSAGMAVNYRAGQLYTDDRTCDSKRRCKLFLVVLDLHTGHELARVKVRGTEPSMGQIFIGRNAVYYIAAQTGRSHGYITRVTAAKR
jgi:hypothetical protein